MKDQLTVQKREKAAEGEEGEQTDRARKRGAREGDDRDR